jgi:hypothetical protein
MNTQAATQTSRMSMVIEAAAWFTKQAGRKPDIPPASRRNAMFSRHVPTSATSASAPYT